MSNPYLAKLHGMIGAQQGQNLKTRHVDEPSKPSKPGFEGFEGDHRSHILEFEADAHCIEVCRIAVTETQKNTPAANPQNLSVCVFAALCKRCPDQIETVRWRRAVEDGRRFLSQWGEQAEALDWTARDLFGLHEVPTNPHPTYQRLSRYDCTGLIWLLQGCPVVALTEATAAIKSPATGSITIYRKLDPPLGAKPPKNFSVASTTSYASPRVGSGQAD